MRRGVLVLAVAGVLGTPAVAAAHVTVAPAQAPAGAATVLSVRVPNERDDAGTVRVDVQFPDGIAAVSNQPVPGWKVTVRREKAAKPIEVHGFEISEQVDRVTLIGDGRRGIVAPGTFQDFPLALSLPPGKAGEKLTFKALQTYEDGEVVRWIGGPESDDPAPQVTLLAAEDGAADVDGSASGDSSASGGDGDESDEQAADPTVSGTDVLTIAALVTGALGLVAGGFALALVRR